MPPPRAGATRDFVTDDKRLYDLIFAPYTNRLSQLGVHALIIAPDGPLFRFPFEALLDPSGKYLLEKYAVSYITTGRDLLRPSSAEHGVGVDIFCAPDFDAPIALRITDEDITPPYRPDEATGAHFPQLPGVRDEGTAIESLMAGGAFGAVHLYDDAAASEDNLRAIEPPSILHVATHGYYFPPTAEDKEALALDATRDLQLSPSPPAAPTDASDIAKKPKSDSMLRSGFVLSGANHPVNSDDDGWITAKEIGKLDLDGTDLVVLSACNTGLGDLQLGEGAQGMCQSFLRAGVKGVILSLFSVPDQATAELMKELYTNLRKGLEPRAALRAAQMSQLQHDPATPPIDWASFVYLGVGRG